MELCLKGYKALRQASLVALSNYVGFAKYFTVFGISCWVHSNYVPYDVGPVIDVMSVSVRSGFGLPRHSSTVVFTGLRLRTREGS